MGILTRSCHVRSPDNYLGFTFTPLDTINKTTFHGRPFHFHVWEVSEHRHLQQLLSTLLAVQRKTSQLHPSFRTRGVSGVWLRRSGCRAVQDKNQVNYSDFFRGCEEYVQVSFTHDLNLLKFLKVNIDPPRHNHIHQTTTTDKFLSA